jgi:hypothetical protein
MQGLAHGKQLLAALKYLPAIHAQLFDSSLYNPLHVMQTVAEIQVSQGN